ncbi:MAG: hypothetical protein WCQ65_10585 [Fermentimonas sp.]
MRPKIDLGTVLILNKLCTLCFLIDHALFAFTNFFYQFRVSAFFGVHFYLPMINYSKLTP